MSTQPTSWANAVTTSSLGSSTTTSSTLTTPWTIHTAPSIGTFTSPWWTNNIIYTNPLKNLNYIINFDHSIDKFDLLEDNIKGVKKNKFIFNCNYDGNRIQPYELIMKLIREKTKFTVTIDISDVLSIKYTNIQLLKIENNLNFGTDCDFSELNVKFKYEHIKYENPRLSTKEVRLDKLKKIKEIQE